MRPKKEYEDLVKSLRESGNEKLVTREMLEVVQETKYQDNLITNYGRNALGNYNIALFWQYYRYGYGTGTPSVNDRSLFTEGGCCREKVSISSDSIANQYDYVNGRVIYTRSWLSDPFEERKTITEGGYTGSPTGYINSHFVLDDPITVEPGDYIAPEYQLIITVTPALTPVSIPAPLLSGIQIPTKAQIETLWLLFPPIDNFGMCYSKDQCKLVSDDSSFAQLQKDMGQEVSLNFNSNASSLYYNLSYTQIVSFTGQPSLGSPCIWKSGSGYAQMVPRIWLVLSGDDSPLSFTENGHIMTDVLYDQYMPYRGTGVASGWDSSYVQDSFQTKIRQVLTGDYGNVSGIRSIAFCIKESPVGTTEWQYRSLFRYLLDEPFNKQAGNVLTLDLKRAWS